MPSIWKCPRCGRTFRQVSQSHSCGVGSRAVMLDGKPEGLVDLYRELEKTLKGLGGVEIVAKGRYALFRTTRIFADLVFMKDALRLAILLDRKVDDPLFFKIGALSGHRVAHVAMLRNRAELRVATRYLKEAHRFARQEDSRRAASGAKRAAGRGSRTGTRRRS